MYVHLGGEVIVPIADIIGIFDARILEQSDDNRKFMDAARSHGRLSDEIRADDRKAVVVTTSGVYVSPISSMTLVRRVTNVQWGLGGVRA